MIELEHRALNSLLNCSMRLGSNGKRFVHDLGWRLKHEPDYRLTEKQAIYLWGLAYTYRRQIKDQDVLFYGNLVFLLGGALPDIYKAEDLRENKKQQAARRKSEKLEFEQGQKARKARREHVL